MTTLVCNFSDVLGTPVPDGIARITSGEVRPGLLSDVIILPQVRKQPLVEGSAVFPQVEPGNIVIHLDWEGQHTSIRTLVPDQETVSLSDCIQYGYTIPSDIETARSLAISARESQEMARQYAQEASSAVTTASAGAVEEVKESVAADKALIEGYKNEAAGSATTAQQAASTAAASESTASTAATNAAASAEEAATHGETSRDAAAVAVAAANSVAQFQGQGFPEGKVVAPVGSVYTDLDATAGAIRWIKTTGTGNTGWAVEYGDTGWRDIASLLPGSTGLMLLRRTGNVVEYALENLDNSAGTQDNFALPIGFRVGKTTHTIISDGPLNIWTLAKHGYVAFGKRKVTSSKYGVWTTSDPWPTTLPGTPA